jgi:ribonuclease P protein component
MSRRSRLSRSRDFDAVYRQGRSVSSRYLVLYTFVRPDDTPTDHPRLGLAVSRRVGNSVERNKVKRLLREAFDQLEPELEAGSDYVLVARPGMAQVADAQGPGWVAEQVRGIATEARAIHGTIRP